MISRKIKNLSVEIIEVDVPSRERIDAEEYVQKILKMYGFTLSRSNITGHPDFKVKRKDGSVFYVEVKTHADGLRKEQAKWIVDNPEKEVLLFYVKQINEERKYKAIQKKKEKEKIEAAELIELASQAGEIV